MKPVDRTLLVFAREPSPGRVKTRLIPQLGEQKATQVYRYLLDHALSSAVMTPGCTVELCCDLPGGIAETCSVLASRYRVTMHQQSGKDLGARMNTAFANAFQHSKQVVLIGSDCPEYTADYLNQAFVALNDHDVVLGPASDGGYVLIGMSQAVPELFEHIAWGTDTVLQATRECLQRAGLTWYEMPVLQDIDTADDVVHFLDFFDGVINDPVD